MITTEDYFGKMSRVAGEEPSLVIRANAAHLLILVNALLDAMPSSIDAVLNPVINSGWRSPSYNSRVPGAAVKSRHMTGEAIDLGDPEGEIDDYLVSHTAILIECQLYMEHPAATKGWCHLQSVPPRSGNRVFYP